MRSLKVITIITALFFNHIALAGIIQNGDFATCDYTGWQTDTDGGASSANDFSINNNGAACSAELQVDHFSPSGDPFGIPDNDAWFNNTLSQSLDFTGAATSTWLLSIDFSVGSEMTSAGPLFIADNYLFGLVGDIGTYVNEKGNDGYLLAPTEIDGVFSNMLTFELDNSFSNISGWFLKLTINVGTDSFGWTDAFGSSLFINEVSLVEKRANVSQVPEPSTAIIFALGLVGLVARKKQHV